MEKVLYVPNLACNLLSIRRLEEAGLKVVFENGFVRVFRSDHELFKGIKKDKLYQFSLNIDRSYSGSGMLELWHHWLRHLNEADVKRLSSKDMANGIGDLSCGSKNFCEPCIFGKQTRKPFPTGNEARSERKLELHSDVCGPITPVA